METRTVICIGSRNAYNEFLKTQRMDVKVYHYSGREAIKGMRDVPIVLLPGWTRAYDEETVKNLYVSLIAYDIKPKEWA